MRLTFLTIFLACCLGCFAKGLQVNVIDQKGKPKKGAMVELKGTDYRGKTDKEGNYTFETVTPNDTLIVYKDSRNMACIAVGDATRLEIVLGKKTFTLADGDNQGEVAYTVKPRAHRNPNIITKEQIRQRNPLNLYDLLSGAVAGVTVTGGEVLIRGVNSVNCPVEPLFVIDGHKVHGSSAANAAVNIYDIETIEVDKNGWEYGVEGANGVIKINTTKANLASP